MWDIEKAVKAVPVMEQYLQGVLEKEQLWENSFIKLQLCRRKQGEQFTLEDHIRAMVYSMLTSQTAWRNISKDIDPANKRLIYVDEVFFQYDPDTLLSSEPQDLVCGLCRHKYGGQSRKAQMEALAKINIPKLIRFEEKAKSVDEYYHQIKRDGGGIQALVKFLSDKNSPNKLAQMGEALVTEYLRNVGYDLAKPDRHICRILGSDYLGCSNKQPVPPYKAMDIVAAIANELGKDWPQQRVDYTLWAYCAKGYGEICETKSPKCTKCTIRTECRYNS